jgi:hypothetical protein
MAEVDNAKDMLPDLSCVLAWCNAIPEPDNVENEKVVMDALLKLKESYGIKAVLNLDVRITLSTRGIVAVALTMGQHVFCGERGAMNEFGSPFWQFIFEKGRIHFIERCVSQGLFGWESNISKSLVLSEQTKVVQAFIPVPLYGLLTYADFGRGVLQQFITKSQRSGGDWLKEQWNQDIDKIIQYAYGAARAKTKIGATWQEKLNDRVEVIRDVLENSLVLRRGWLLAGVQYGKVEPEEVLTFLNEINDWAEEELSKMYVSLAILMQRQVVKGAAIMQNPPGLVNDFQVAKAKIEALKASGIEEQLTHLALEQQYGSRLMGGKKKHTL